MERLGGGWRLGSPQAGGGGGEELNLVEKWRTGCLPQGNKTQGPPERTSGKSSGGFHANVIHSENGSLLRRRERQNKQH